MSEDPKNRTQEDNPIEIDYADIDVAAIMDQIKGTSAARPQLMSQETPPSASVPERTPPAADPQGDPSSFKIRMKTILLKLMRPFTPLIKLLVFPIHQELRRTIDSLDLTNRRLDFLFADMEKIAGLSDAVNRRLDSEVPPLREDVVFLREYVQLLHNLSHNLVVEMTKLKIEEETLKNKVRIMEKDFEFLGKRERALEEDVLK